MLILGELVMEYGNTAIFVPLCKFKLFQGTHLKLYKYYMSTQGKETAKHSVTKKEYLISLPIKNTA